MPKIIHKILSSGLVMLWVSVLVLILDRYSKLWVMQHLGFHESLPVLPFFNLTLAYNTGAAFSFLDSASGWQGWFLGGLAMIVCMIVIGWQASISSRDYWMGVALSLILGGALGNVWDRISYGHVIDMLSFHWGEWYFAIFNVADSAICVGAFMIGCYWLVKGKK